MFKSRNSYTLIIFSMLLGCVYFCLHRQADTPEITSQITREFLQKKLSIFETNLLNLNTFGYRKVDDILQGPADGKPIVVRNFEQASLTRTGRHYDVAVTSKGFLQFKTRSDKLVYSRNGQLLVDSNRAVCHVRGPCIWPEIHIAKECRTETVNDFGEVLCRQDGHTKKLGKIQLFDFNNKNGLASKDSIWFTETAKSGRPIPIDDGSVIEGYLEDSNLDEKTALKRLRLAKKHLRLVDENL